MNDLMFYLLGIIKSAPKTNPIREDALLNSGLANPIDITDAIKDLKHLEYIKSPIGGNTLLVTSKGRIAYNEFEQKRCQESKNGRQQRFQNKVSVASALVPFVIFVLGLIVDHCFDLIHKITTFFKSLF